jgi:hypothetical protein
MRHIRLLFAFLALIALCVPAAAADSSCRLKPGVWSWFANGDVTFTSDGKLSQVLQKPIQGANGRIVRGKITAKWTCSRGIVTIVWSIGYVDKLVLSRDGKKLAGSNQNSVVVSGQWKHS